MEVALGCRLERGFVRVMVTFESLGDNEGGQNCSVFDI
jgi:hypothetical protein